MFETYNTSSVAHGLPSQSGESIDSKADYKDKTSHSGADTALALRGSSLPDAERKVFLGRMGTDDSFTHSIPNAWMGSTPGHPFWLLPLEFTSDNINNNGVSPESLTGPEALYHMVERYKNDFDQGQGSKMDEYYDKSPWRRLYKAAAKENATLPPQSLVIAPFWQIYPYSWHRDGEMVRHVCWVLDDGFNAARCKLLLASDRWGSYSITYWSHSWGWDGDGHSKEHIKHLSGSNEEMENKQEEEEDDAGKEWSQQAEKLDAAKKKEEEEKKPQRRRR